jgi:hypothetical protein
VQKRCGVGRKPLVQSVQPSGGRAPRSGLSASPHKDRTFPTRKLHSRRDGHRITDTLFRVRETCSPLSYGSRRPARTLEDDQSGFRAVILSGFPSITIRTFPQCPTFRPMSCECSRDRRPEQVPLAREDIPHIPHRMNSTHLRLAGNAFPNFDL